MCLVIDSFARDLPNYSFNVCVCFFFFSFFGGKRVFWVYFPFGYWSFDDDGLLLPACMHATELWISLWLQSKQIKTEF